MEVLLFLGLILFVFWIMALFLHERKFDRWVKREAPPEFQDWKFGTPDDPIPKSAVPLSQVEMLTELVKKGVVGPVEITGEGRGLENLSFRQAPEPKSFKTRVLEWLREDARKLKELQSQTTSTRCPHGYWSEAVCSVCNPDPCG